MLGCRGFPEPSIGSALQRVRVAPSVACATEFPSQEGWARSPTRHHRDRCHVARVSACTHSYTQQRLENFLTDHSAAWWPDGAAGAGALAGIGVLKKTNIQLSSTAPRPVVENAPRALLRRAVRGDSSESAGVFLLNVGSPVRQPAPSATSHPQVARRLRGDSPCPHAPCSLNCTP